LGDFIARAVADNLVVLLGSADVTATPLENFDPAYQVSISVQRFESVQGEAATFEAVWMVRRAATAESRSGRTVAARLCRAPASIRSPQRITGRSRN
jgi:uncharacterized lipoprotein YmbA